MEGYRIRYWRFSHSIDKAEPTQICLKKRIRSSFIRIAKHIEIKKKVVLWQISLNFLPILNEKAVFTFSALVGRKYPTRYHPSMVHRNCRTGKAIWGPLSTMTVRWFWPFPFGTNVLLGPVLRLENPSHIFSFFCSMKKVRFWYSKLNFKPQFSLNGATPRNWHFLHIVYWNGVEIV